MATDTAYMRDYLRKRYHERLDALKVRLGGRCVVCGSREDLEFDHVDRTNRSFDITRLSSVTFTALEAELTKCQLLCNSCHIEKTVKECGHNRRTEHGTEAAYRHGGCRCDPCRDAHRTYQSEWRARRATRGQ